MITPNSLEARQLAPEADTLDACALALLDRGAEYVLVTGTHENTPHVVNALYQGHRLLESFTWDRLPHSYHGSGCTLAACIAGMIAHGLEPFHAIHEAQEFTWHALQQAIARAWDNTCRSVCSGRNRTTRWHCGHYPVACTPLPTAT